MKHNPVRLAIIPILLLLFLVHTASSLAASPRMNAYLSTVLTGTLTDQFNGQPVANAIVTFVSVDQRPDEIYRFEITQTNPDINGHFTVQLESSKSYLTWNPAYNPFDHPFFLEVSAPGYADAFLFQDLGRDIPFPAGLLKQPANVFNAELVPKSSLPLQISEGRFMVSFWKPEEEPAAHIGLSKMRDFYARDVAILGVDAPSPVTDLRFVPEWVFGRFDWTGDFDGITTAWKPWYDGLDGVMTPQLDSMWNAAVPHELVHHILFPRLHVRSWFHEGMATMVGTYMVAQGLSLDQISVFVSGEPFQDMQPANMPQYDAAAGAIASIAMRHGHELYLHELIRVLLTYQEKVGREISDSELVGIMGCVAGEDLVPQFREWHFTIEEMNLCQALSISPIPATLPTQEPTWTFIPIVTQIPPTQIPQPIITQVITPSAPPIKLPCTCNLFTPILGMLGLGMTSQLVKRKSRMR